MSDEKTEAEKCQCWWVPLSYTTSAELKFDDTKPKRWLTGEGPVTFTSDLGDEQWLLFNIKAAGKMNSGYCFV